MATTIPGAATGAKPDGKTTTSATTSPAPSPSPTAWTGPPSSKLKLQLRDTISSAEISPKSVVSTGTGYVFAQNMMYRHTITVYDSKSLKLVKTIPDSVDAAKVGIKGHTGTVKGAPVEAAVTPDGRFMYVSQYSMYGDGFYHEGTDMCSPSSNIDRSYVYRVPLDTLKVDTAIKVGAVPKFVAVTPDQKYLLVSNWCSYTLSVVDVNTNKQIKSIYLGPYPRGIAVDPESRYAYVAVMGTYNIARVDLGTFTVSWINGVGSGPRHLCMAGDGKYLYATLNGEGNVAKIDTQTKQGRGQGPDGNAAAQHGDRPRRQVPLRGQLRLQHDDQGAHRRHEGDPDGEYQRAAHRHHLRCPHEERLGLLLHRQHPGVRRPLSRLHRAAVQPALEGMGERTWRRVFVAPEIMRAIRTPRRRREPRRSCGSGRRRNRA